MSDLSAPMVEYFEGLKFTAYKDTLDKWTIGYGHLLPPGDWTGYTITQDEADQFLKEDLSYASTLATGFPNYQKMNDVRQAVCISMCFQMGSKPLYWPKFNAALEVQDYKGAAQEGLNSEWARQTPARAALEMSMLETGEWQIP
jgi:lysozyme